MKLVRKNGDPVWTDKSLIKNPSTRLRFSIWVIIANFILGVIGMLLGADLTALGVFLGLANAPLYAYILGSSFKPSVVPEKYFEQQHGGAGGLGTIIHSDGSSQNTSISTQSWGSSTQTQKPDEFNNPTYSSQSTVPLPTIIKPEAEIG